MIGKKNIVFGFLFLVFTASLGPYMVTMYEGWGQAYGEKQQSVGRLQQLQTDDFEEDLEPLNADQIARANTGGILAMNKLYNTELNIDMIKGGPHAHGNLESVLNIIVGVVLLFVSASPLVKQIISWLFILGTLLHSGMLYLERVLQLEFAASYLQTSVAAIGPLMLLVGLLLMALVTAKSLRDHVVRD